MLSEDSVSFSAGYPLPLTLAGKQHHSHSRKAITGILIAWFCVICVCIGLPMLFLNDYNSLHSQWALFVAFAFTVGCAAGATTIHIRFIRWSILALLAFNYIAVWAFMMYWATTNYPLDIYFITDSLREALPTAIRLMGIYRFFLLLGVLGICATFLGAMFYRCGITLKSRWFSVFGWHPIIALVIIVSAGSISIPKLHAAFLQDYSVVKYARDTNGTIFPRSVFETHSKENVFILQLESINGLALNGDAIVDGKSYKGDFIPHMKAVAQDGVFFPHFWGNDIQTNRAQATILCGIVNNLKKAFSFRPEEIPSVCLPQQMKDSEYTTIAYRSDRLGFANTGNFMTSIGFDEVHSDDIMKEGDRRYPWGWDDCTFYTRAFENLQSAHPEKAGLFAYFEVSMHHVGFEQKEEYKDVSVFPDAVTHMERYINSARAQDHCVGVFYDLFKEYAPENTHLIILGDHSWPFGIQGNTNNERIASTDNFVTSLAYIPPRSRLSEFSSGKTVSTLRYSQTDIVPTIFSVLNRRSYENSFAFELASPVETEEPILAHGMTKKNYEECHVLVQPYGGARTAIVHGPLKYTYHLDTRKLEKTNIDSDLLETHGEVLAEDISYSEFLDRFMCARFVVSKRGGKYDQADSALAD
jgi:phosphoglycerol transferase MdoB-like AlkP superfamily enzyme